MASFMLADESASAIHRALRRCIEACFRRTRPEYEEWAGWGRQSCEIIAAREARRRNGGTTLPVARHRRQSREAPLGE